MRKPLMALLVAVALVGAACGDDGDTASTGTGSEGGGTTYRVQVDAQTDAFNMNTIAYFPKALTVHPGDTVDFETEFTGEPHTVTLGALVDKGLAAAKAAGPDSRDEPPELKKLPVLLPEGPGDANQMAANPCFVDSGEPAFDKACPEREQPAFDGTQSIYNSGYLDVGANFEVPLADDISPGTYSFFCLLHRSAMTGSITVVPEDQKAQTPDEVEAAGKKELDDTVGKLRPVAEAVRKGALPPFAPSARPDQVIAGGGSPEVQDAGLSEFGPKETSIPVGGSVTWLVFGPHTISFKAAEDLAVSPVVKGPDGKYHANEAALAPAGGPGMPAPPEAGHDEHHDEAAAPPASGGPPPPPTIVDGGSWNGEGFRSSGIFVSFPPQLFGYKLKFTKAGTFPYKCLIHPDMEGTVKVG